MRTLSILITMTLVVVLPSFDLSADPPTEREAVAKAAAPARLETEVPQMPGFPIVLEAGDDSFPPWNVRGPVLANLDGTGDLEVVYSSTSCVVLPGCDHGQVWAWGSDGKPVEGFPITVAGSALFAPSVGDLDGDGDEEIVQITIDENWTSHVYGIDHRGAVLPGFPALAGDASVVDGAALFDLDRDGALEIVYSGSTALYVFESDGSQWSGVWPIPLSASAHGTPSVGDVDGDGQPEILASGHNSLSLFKTDGTMLPGWPVSLYDGPHQLDSFGTGVLADLDGDGDLEVVISGGYEGEDVMVGDDIRQTYVYQVHALHHDGTPVAGWPQTLPARERWLFASSAPLVTDFEDDGVPEIIVGHEELSNGAAMLFAWDAAGTVKQGFPATPDSSIKGVPSTLTAADIDGDGIMEVFSDTFLSDGDWIGWILGIDAGGQTLTGFPLRPQGMTDLNGAIFADVDHDGDYELATATLNLRDQTASVYLYDLSGHYAKSHRDWLTYHATNHRGGLAKSRYRGWRVGHGGSRPGGGR